MPDNNRPVGRKRNKEEGGLGVHRRGEGLGGGKVGSGSGNPAGGRRPSSSQQSGQRPSQNLNPFGTGRPSGGSSGGGQTRSGLGGKLLPIILIVLLLGGGGGIGNLLGLFGGGSSNSGTTVPSGTTQPQVSLQQVQNIFASGAAQTTASSWSSSDNTGRLNTSVAKGARDKFTTLKGNGKDSVTIMVYMCGADLESRSGMATSDLQEMASAKLSDKVNIIVQTGGSKSWHIDGISNRVNQIYQVRSRQLIPLEENAGSGSMTDPATLQTFLSWCGKNYPADRQILIFWDHGGGSLTGYGYDETHSSSGSMTLTGINSALKKAGLKFDFIGFDTCLMATAENALMLSDYADYLVASEETEPGTGWYYTDWLTTLSSNTSISTLQLGKQICDDFVSVSNTQCRGQKTTLSVVDLAELSATFRSAFTAFSQGTHDLIADGEYKTVSSARSNTREFAAQNAIDQIDLVHFARNLGTDESKKLADVLLSAIKYNRTNNITNAYGLSIYFPYRKTTGVKQAIATYDNIGLDEEYSDCIREFAGLAVSGQVASGGVSSSPISSLFGMGNASTAGQSSDDIMQLLNMFMGGSGSSSGGSAYSSLLGSLLSGRSLSMEQTAEYIEENHFDPSQLVWTSYEDRDIVILPQEQWDLVQDLDLNLFYDDGEGFIDLGLDNIYEFDAYGNLTAGAADGYWISINKQPVAYYRMSTSQEGDSYTIMGYVPAELNGDRVKLILIFSDENPDGYIAGALPSYDFGETETVARGLIELQEGDELDFLCDYYDYDGNYQDSYYLGETMTVTDEMTISDTFVGGSVVALYKFTDIYGQTYWTEPVPMG